MSAAADRLRRGFTLLEVMVATIILSLGLVARITAFMQCQRIMRATQGFETAQYVLMLGETLYPLPSPDLVTDDPLDNELLNIEATDRGEHLLPTRALLRVGVALQVERHLHDVTLLGISQRLCQLGSKRSERHNANLTAHLCR